MANERLSVVYLWRCGAKDRIFSHWKLLSVGIEVVLSQEEGKTPGLIYLASVFVRENGLIRYEYEAK